MPRWDPEPLIKRFEDRFIPEPNSGCFLWTGEIDAYGYGSFFLQKEKVGPGKWKKIRIKAHQQSWKLYCGEIPEGQEICHNCDMPACVNPDHLFIGTHYENMRDRDIKGRGSKKVLLTPEAVLAIRAKLAAGEERNAIAREFGVTYDTIRCVRDGRSWKHVT